ncbi:hypothetical protein C8Q76DRAFT_605350 [Earliella scabrosa]|nr:hypothetical protein C8Q76DRAFT_605350 [Earliella scabrosa]
MTSVTGLFVVHDSGVPQGSVDYTTLVLLHGYAWHSAIFDRLLPYAGLYNTRIILVNRRDYPGTLPYTAGELSLLPESLSPITDPEELKQNKTSITLFIKHRGHELLRFLTELIQTRGIPRAQPGENKDGIVVAGWSLGVLWMNAILAHAASYSHYDVDLNDYLRRVILYDGPNCFFSFPAPNNSYNPVLDPANDVASPVVSDWISGFYSHGTTIDTLVERTPVDDPPPTVRTMGLDDIRNCVYIPSDATGNSDKRLLLGGHFAGVFADLWNDAIAIAPEPSHARKALRDVEVRVVWCERSIWETVLAGWNIKTEMEDARSKGRTVRNVSAVCLRGGNHFAHWHDPEGTLRVFLAPAGELEE